MRIAICLSGQPRTIEFAAPNVIQYFSGEHEYDFFCHSWDYDTYKRKRDDAPADEQPIYWDVDSNVDINWLTEKINVFKPKKYIIDSSAVIGTKFSWASLTYSLMMANNLKKQYEIENNFRYDCVVRSRYDLIFDPTGRFYVDPIVNKSQYLDILCLHSARMSYEFNRQNVSDEFFYGSSTAMDLISELHRKIKKHIVRQDDYDLIGPGAFMSDFAEERNLRITPEVNNGHTTVFRPEVSNLDPLTSFGYHQIHYYASTFYKL